jgi:predicted alpha/beta superfamily hydrolase
MTNTQYQETNKSNFIICLQTQTDDFRPIYVTGNFNNWKADDERYRMLRVGVGRFELDFSNLSPLLQVEALEYKFVRGGWENQELDEFGSPTQNRRVLNPSGRIHNQVSRWMNYGISFNPSFLPIKHIVSEAFDMPQLDRQRRVVALLPYDYYKSDKRYPVIYLHDAQNLFDKNSPYGNWAIDEKIAVLTERNQGEFIVIAVDHGGTNRQHEFNPLINHLRLGKGEGRKWVKFMAQTLKPHIDATLRTLPQREHTAIGGSSLGGLVSIYAGLMFPDIYAKLMIFSPSLWLTQHVRFEEINFMRPQATKIYIYAGGKEGASMLPNVDSFRENMGKLDQGRNQVEIKCTFDPNGEHSEANWGIEFPKAMEWLFS